LVGLLSACSGKYYEVGSEAAGAAGAVNNGNAGAAGTGPIIGVGGRADNTAGASNVAGAPSAAGAAGAPDTGVAGASSLLTSYCGVQFPIVPPELPTLPPTQAFEAVRLFVAGDDVNAPGPVAAGGGAQLPEIAGQYALQLLDYYAAPPPHSAPGMRRFVDSYLPGTPNTNTWAPFFTNNTLPGLMTSDAVLPKGAGIFTDQAVLGNISSFGTGITKRGAYISGHFLCRALPDPPPNIPALEAQKPGQTRRERLEAARAAPACATCHQLADAIGFSLEHFDYVGAYSTVDNGQAIDSSGVYITASQQPLMFSAVNDLAQQLASSCEAVMCITQQLLDDARQAANLKPLQGDVRSQAVARIAQGFAQQGSSLPELVRLVAENMALSQ
jgi:hypothetical protein